MRRAVGLAVLLLATAGVSTQARAEDRFTPVITAAFEGGVASRTLTWNDDLFGVLRPYKLAPAAVLGGELVLHPGAFFTPGKLGWLGVALRGEGFVGAHSQRTEHDQALPTRGWAFSAALRGRMPFSVGAAWLDAGVAGRGFSIDKVGYTDPDIPSVRFLGPQLGAGVEIDLPAGLFIAPRAAVARWVGAGDLASAAWFPHARAWGTEIGLRVGITYRYGIGTYIDATWSRDLAALRPQPGDAHVAGGMADDRFAVKLGMLWMYPER